MRISDFKLERYFAAHEFKVKHLLSPSDCENMRTNELLEMADGECLKLWNGLKLSYTETKGHPLLREEIASMYDTIEPENVIVTIPEEGIFIALNVLLSPGDHVIIVDPSYQSLNEIPRAIGCEVSLWPLRIRNNRWCLEMDYLEKTIKGNTRLIIINFPHNPTGFIPGFDDIKRIIEIAGKHNLYVFSDEMYRFLELSPEFEHGSFADMYENAIVLGGLSKSFGLPGLRTGWLASRNTELIRKFEGFKDYTSICHNSLSEILGIIAIRNRNSIIGKNLELIRSNLNISRIFFIKYNRIFNWIDPEGGSVAFPSVADKLPAGQLCKALLDQQSILLLPSGIFNFAGNHVRIGLGRKDLEPALADFGSFLDKIT